MEYIVFKNTKNISFPSLPEAVRFPKASVDNEQPKKLIILNILDILRKYTVENHTLSQREIWNILKNEYNMTVDRKAIRRNLINLLECGYEIEYSESLRTVTNKKTGNPEESCIWSDFWLVRNLPTASCIF